MANKKAASNNIGCLVIGLFLTLLVIGAISGSSNDEQDDGSTVAVSGTLASLPDFRIYTNAQMRSVYLILKEYPNKAFAIANDELEKTRYDMMRTYLSAGDTVFLQVPARDMNDTNGYTTVRVYAVRSTSQVYLKE